MAAGATRSGTSGIFWMNGVSDEEQPLVFVPGVDAEVITRTTSTLGPASTSTSTSTNRGTKMSGTSGRKKQGHLQSDRSGAYTKETASVHQSEHTPSLAFDNFLPPSQIVSEISRARSQVCLKDLCSEDKRRIANLIEELARVSEEKEESVQRLKDEHETFEHKIQQLEQQNLVIVHERESLQQQYRECQELLGLYQKYLSQQQAKLNESIAQLSQAPAHNKVRSGDEAHSGASTTRADGSRLDGSYLGLPVARARQPQVQRGRHGGGGAAQTLSDSASISSVSEISPSGWPVKRHRIHKECGAPQLESCDRCEPVHDSGTGQRRNDKSPRPENGRHDDPKPCERLQSRAAVVSESNEGLTRPQLGHEDWEEKRHQLLMQKMQLERERERLQARLEEQEERLHRQNQQLRQSRLDYSRFRQTTRAELGSSTTQTEDPPLEDPCRQDLPSGGPGDADLNPADPVDNGARTCAERTRRHAATSPRRLPASLRKPTSTSAPVTRKSPETRSDFSLVELLDIFSPVSAAEQSRTSNPRTKMTLQRPTPKPVARTLLTSAGPQSTQQDLEESQILEDIFFVC